MIIAASTFTDPVIYNRIKSVQESVHQALRQQILDNWSEITINWMSEKITTELIKESNRKCEDRLRVTLEVETLK